MGAINKDASLIYRRKATPEEVAYYNEVLKNSLAYTVKMKKIGLHKSSIAYNVTKQSIRM